MTTESLTNWIPIRVYWQDAQLLVDWCRFDHDGFREPFFDDTVQRLLRRPFNLLFRRQTPVERLGDLCASRPGLSPAGFIFHMSRCGSTLMAQMLAALPQNVVISEPDPIDSVLRAHYKDPAIADEQRTEWLRGVVSALGQQRTPEQAHLFVKFDSWSIVELPLIRRAFPSVPWVFLYRNPVEVLASHLRQRGVHMVPGMIEPQLFGLTGAQLAEMRAEEYCARVLGTVCKIALRHGQEANGLLVNYTDLPQALWSSVAAHFGLSWSAAERSILADAARRDSKNPWQEYQTPASSPAAKAVVHEVCAQWVLPAYERLEDLRLARGSMCSSNAATS